MKKLLIILIILIIPMAAFADFMIGPTAYYNFPLIQEEGGVEIPELAGVDASDFSFGLDARLKLFIFQLQGTALITPGVTQLTGVSDVLPTSMDLFVDAGLAFDIAFVRLGLGVGPSWSFFFGDSSLISDTVSMGMNAKATVDLLLGPVAIGVNYLTQFDFDLQDAAGNILDADKTQGLFGVSVMLRL